MRIFAVIVRTAAALCLTAGAGCRFDGGPRARWGFTPDCCFGNPGKLGVHSYSFGTSEGFGIFYTLRGGSIDLDHLRGVADLTRHTYDKTFNALMKKAPGFSVGPAFEWTTAKVRIEYPADWDRLDDAHKRQTAHAAALIVAPAVAYHTAVWHEMLTWKGTRFAFFEPEFNSAFSWDDLYSDALGAKLAVEALQKGKLTNDRYNRAMTDLIKRELEALGVVSKQEAAELTASVRGQWYGGGRLIKRNMDVGFDDGLITPSLIPGPDAEPAPLPMPTLDGLEPYGLRVAFTVSSAYFENAKLRQMADTDTDVEPLKHFPVIMQQIEREAEEKNFATR